MTGPENAQNWTWKVHFDGAVSNSQRGAGIVMRAPDGSIVEQSIEIECPITNKQVEYEALIAALKLAANIGAES